ncbi:hypothetical protein HZA97_03815 [Candidatus Woesearchaeota archaeon]|nr:hypothetical protein [Candidatus Woesearchaeota archaeon]
MMLAELKKKEVEKALEEAKRIESKLLPEKEIVSKYEEGIETLEKLKKLLKPDWFTEDELRLKTAKKKNKKQ